MSLSLVIKTFAFRAKELFALLYRLPPAS